MFLFLYHLTWTLVVIVLLPFIPLLRHQRLFTRLGIRLPPVHPHNQTMWMHALSVGEVISATPLVKALKQKYPSHDIIFSVTTSQGMKIARTELGGQVRALIQMPLDFWWSAGRIVRRIRPGIFLLVETDLWPGLIHHLGKRGIKTILINGRISPRTFKSYRRYSSFVRRMFAPFDKCLMQTHIDAERLLRIGIEAGKIKTVGNIKFDQDWKPMGEKEHKDWLTALNFHPENWIWVAGSTHKGEEDIILDVFARLRSLFPKLRLIIAPRALEQAEGICRVSQNMGLRTVLKTDLSGNETAPCDVLVLNTMGELGRIYGIAKISFVGGSLVSAGGHNLLEPASFGCPVLFGPHTEDFLVMAELLIEAGGGERVKDSEGLFETLKDLLSDPERIGRMGQNAKEFVKLNKGALNRVLEHIGMFI